MNKLITTQTPALFSTGYFSKEKGIKMNKTKLFNKQSSPLLFILMMVTGLFSLTGYGQSNPSPFNISSNWTLGGWATTVAALSYPGNGATGADNTTGVVAGATSANMVFWKMSTADPVITATPGSDYTGAYTGGNGTITGNGTSGFLFDNTGGANIGGACLSINTTGRNNIQVAWTCRTTVVGARNYGIRLRYRVGHTGAFTDASGTLASIDYTGWGTVGSQTFSAVTLPSAVEGQAEVQVLWQYYYFNSTTGTRPKMGVDDITVSSSAATPTITPSTASLSGLTYVLGAGPSTASSFTLSASSLTSGGGTITINGSTDYEVSTTSSTTGFGSSATLTYTGTGTLSPNTVYVRLKAGLAAGSYNSETLSISGGTGSASVTASGSVSAGTPSIALSNGTITSGNITQNTTNNVLYQTIVSVSTASATLSTASFTTAGTYSAADISNLQLWYSTSSTFSAGTSASLSTVTTGLGTGTHSFSSLSQSFPVGTGYLYVTADLPCGTIGNTINISAISTGSLTFVTGSPTGSGFTDGGSQTISVSTPANATGSAAAGTGTTGQVTVSWTNPTCFTEVMIVASPATNTGGTPTGDGSAYTANLAYTTGTVFGNGFVVYRGSTSPQTVTGLTNGTTYYFKIFSRNGTVWSAGTEVTGTPFAPSFTAGHIAVLVAAASAANTTGTVIDLAPTTAGQSAANSFPIPSSTVTLTNQLRFSGSASSTAYVSNSDDGTLLCFTGGNTIDAASNINTILNRGVGSFNGAAAYNLATTYTGASGNQTRGASTVNDVNYFIGDQGSFYTNGASAASPTGSNVRSVKSFGGTVYAFTASATLAPVGIISAATGGTYTALPGLGSGATTRQDFYLVSSGSNGSAYDILYVLDATSATVGAIYKYSLVSGSWTANGSYTTTFGGFGLAAQKSGGGANIWVTTGTGASTNNSVILLNDAAGFNATINITTGSNVILYTATGGAIIKGVAMSPVTPQVSLAAAHPASGNIAISSTDNIIGGISVTVTNARAILSGVTVTTAGGYAIGDIATNGFKLWLSSSATSIAGATQLGTSQAAVNSGGNISVSGLSNQIAVGTSYILATASISSGATINNTIRLASTANINITFSNGTITSTGPVAGGATPGNDQTIVALTPTIALSNGTVTSGNITQNTTNNLLYQAIVAVGTTSATLNSASFTTAGTYSASDITNLKLWYSPNATFSSSSPSVLLSAITTSLGTGVHSFSSLTQSFPIGTGYLYVTADLPCGTLNNTINISAISNTSLTFATGTPTGSAFTDGGVQTISPSTPVNVSANLTNPTGNSGQVTVSWTNPSCFTEVMIVATPSVANSGGTPSGNGSAYTANLAYNTGGASAFGNGFVVYKGASSPQTVTGLTDGTIYYYKIFTRNGTLWSAGVESSATSNALIYYNTFTGAGVCPTAGNVPVMAANSTGEGLARSLNAGAATPTCQATAATFNSTTLNVTNSVIDSSYIQFSATAATGYQLNPTSLSFFSQVSNTGPNQMEVRYSTDNFATYTAWGAAPNSVITPGALSTWDFPDFSTLGGGSVTFRLYPYGTVAGGGGASSAGGTVRFNNITLAGTVSAVVPPTVDIEPAHPTAANINQGTNDNIIGALSLAVTAANAYLNGVTVNTAGTYTSSDIATNGFKVWLSPDGTLGSATQLGTDQAAVNSGSTISVSGFPIQTILNGNTAYILVTASIKNTATVGHTIRLATTNETNITFVNNSVDYSATPTNPIPGGATPGNDQTIILAVPTISLSATTVPTGFPTQFSTNNVLYQTNVTVGNTSAQLSSASFTTTGTYSSTDISNLQLWYSTSSTFDGSAVSISTLTTGLGTGSHTFGSLSQTFPIGTGYLYVTTDFPCAATTGKNIKISALALGNYSFLTGTPTGSGAAGGTQTISATTLNDVTLLNALPTGNTGEINLTWVNPVGCFDEVMVVATPLNPNDGIPTGDGTAYTADINYVSGTPFGVSSIGNVVYKGTATSINVEGLTNGTLYYFKVFTRFGTTWETATTPEVSATPSKFVSLTEIIMPQYIEGNSSTNSNRIPFACLFTINNLTPNATYRYYPGIVISTDLTTANGAGNCIFPNSSGNFGHTTGASLSSSGNYGTLTANASGTYTGWFAIEPTGNARFTPGNSIYFKINLNDGAGGTSIASQAVSTHTAQVVSLGSGANTGTALRGLSSATAKNFVVAYDNTAGTGRPLSATFVEDDGYSETTSYASFYTTSVNGVAGAYGMVIPNANANGVRRLEQRDIVTGTIFGCAATSSNGHWPSGANTVNPSSGTTAIVITNTDAPLSQMTITASSGTNGSISPTGVTSLNCGNNQSYTITPNTCYHISDVLVDGISNSGAISTGTYTFSSVSANHTISATFAADALPTVSNPGAQSANTISTGCTAVVTYTTTTTGSITPTVSYSFAGATTASGSGDGSGSTFNKGVTNVTLTATNTCGSTTSLFNVTVTDATAPATPTLADVTGECTATAIAPTTTDNCAGIITGTTTDATTYSTQGTHVIHWTFDDGNGNTTTANQNVVIHDTQAPVISGHNASANSSDDGAGDCSFTSSGTTPNTGSYTITGDNCSTSFTVVETYTFNSLPDGTANFTLGTNTFFPVHTYQVGVTTVDVAVTDDAGNTAHTSFTQTVIDDELPTITAPADITMCSLTPATITSLGTPVTGDNCGTNAATNNHPSTTYPIGTTLVTWTVTDIHGHSATATQHVIVNQTPVGSASNIVICQGASSNLALNSTVSGTSYTWASSVITGAVLGNGSCSIGCGTTISDILRNTGTVHGVVEYTVTPTANGCPGSPFTVDVTIGATPAVPAAILGPNAVCQMTSATYSVTAVPEATNYIWTFAPATGSATPAITTVPLTTVAHGGYLSYGNTITVTIPAGTVIGTYSVAAKNNCGTSATASLSITKKPGTPGAISGPLTLCGIGTATAIYKIAPVPGATSYTWTLPAGITIASGTGTDSINVSVAPTFVTGNIAVVAVNACGSIPGTTITVTGKTTAAPSTITGPTSVCSVTTATYTASTVVGATSYQWTLPGGFGGTSTTSSINIVNTGFTSGSITVAGVNACGTGTSKSAALSVAATLPLAITGPAVTCGLTSAAYSVPVVTGATGYNWTVPAAATITSGLGSTGITVSFAAPLIGSVSVTSSNGCATSAARSLTVNKITATPGAITGPSTGLCAAGTAAYSIAPVTGATGYTWFPPAGISIVSGQGTTSISVNVTTLTTGALKVSAQDACGTSAGASLTLNCADPNEISSGTGATERNSFKLYPNPATNEFTITCHPELVEGQQLTMEMFDILGNIVKKSLINNPQSSINIEQLKQGMYFVRLFDKDNNVLYTERVIKE